VRQVPPIIDPEFQRLIPPLEASELWQLEENIRAHGCRDALVTWHGLLVDGHNRLHICVKHKLPFSTIAMEFENRDAVMLWMEENQLGRRNLTDDQRAVIGLSISQRRTAKAKGERASKAGKTGGNGRPKQSSLPTAVVGKLPKNRSKESARGAAKEARVSERKIRTLQKLAKVAPELLPKIRAGAMTIANAKAETQRANRLKIAAEIRTEAPKYPEGPFRVIVVDPPWRYDVRQEDATHRARTPYPDMSQAELKALPIAKVAHTNAILWLWTTNSFMRDALELIEAWGFSQKTILTWVKDRMGTGAWLRGQTEHCIMAIRGKPVVTLTNQTTALQAPLREHSRKPEQFYTLVESLCPGNRLELFARAEREGWATTGAEVGRFKEK
jgi:N6-adenosine-specific RNA methylase IME4